MKMMGWQSTIAGVAKAYEDFLDVLIADHADEAGASAMNGEQPRVLFTNTIMSSMEAKHDLARFALEACAAPQGARS